MVSRFSHVQLFATCEPQATRLLCPWDSPGKNTGVSCHAFLQGIFPTQGMNPCLLVLQVEFLPLSHRGSPKDPQKEIKGVKRKFLYHKCTTELENDHFVNPNVITDSN